MPCVIWVNVRVNALLRLCSLQGNGYISTLPSLQSHLPPNSAAHFTQQGRKGHLFSLSRWSPLSKESSKRLKSAKAELGKSNVQQIEHISEWEARRSGHPILPWLLGSSIRQQSGQQFLHHREYSPFMAEKVSIPQTWTLLE